MKSVLTFESMITPKIITFLYWLLLLGVRGRWRRGDAELRPHLVRELRDRPAGDGRRGARGAHRCELLIVLFKINEHMQTVSKRL
jgi:hypothetical protein